MCSLGGEALGLRNSTTFALPQALFTVSLCRPFFFGQKYSGPYALPLPGGDGLFPGVRTALVL